MNNKTKGILHLLLVVVAIGLLAGIAFIGFGPKHLGQVNNIRRGLDLDGGVSVTYESKKANPTKQELADTVYQLQKRVESISTEAEVYAEGTNRISVDIPGAKDPEAVFKQLGKQGSLEFKDESGKIILTGSAVSTAEAITQADQTSGISENVVRLTLTEKGKKLFADATEANIGKAIIIYYDGKEISRPTVQAHITDGIAIISGSFEKMDEAKSLANSIKLGALKLELKDIRRNVVSAQLGVNALKYSLYAGVIGVILIILFMSIYYRLPGFAASIALLLYILVVLVVINVMDVTLTLPGIAGVILSIGMAVDANIIIFARIREELALGKTTRTAIKIGFEKALTAIVDGNVTTIIAAVVLYLFGSGTVKGFAQTLAIGVILSMLTALFVTKFIMFALCDLGFEDVKFYGVQKVRKTIDFIGNYKKYLLISGTLFAICIGGLVYNQVNTGSPLNYSLDFVGGNATNITMPASQDITSNTAKTELADLVKKATTKTAVISATEAKHVMTVRTTELTIAQQNAMNKALIEKYKVTQAMIETESISATVSGEMKNDAVMAVVIATICMLVYIWFRFRSLSFGAGSVFSLLHDVIVVLLVYAVFSQFITVGGTFIACMLTILGYCINATIVIFDRIRENRKTAGSRADLRELVNHSITQTLSRSINTNLTVFIIIFVLAILGVDAVRQFAIPLMVGVLCGVYSSICVAGPLWYFFTTRFGKDKVKTPTKR